MLDLISIGSLCIDLYYRGEELTADAQRFHLAIGGKYEADELHQSVGGGGVKVAVGAKQYGLEVAVLGMLGDNPFKEVILSALDDNKIQTHLCQIKKDYLNVSTILLAPSGERSIIHYEPPHEDLFSKIGNMKDLLTAEAVYIGNLPDVPLSQRTELLEYVKSSGLMTFLNLGSHDLKKPVEELFPLIKAADVLILNGHEFADLTKKEYSTFNFKSDITAGSELFTGKVLIVTDSGKGSYGYQTGTVFFQEALAPEKIVDTTGAGDGYTAGFISHYLKSKDVKAAMKQGAERAAAVLSKIGAN